ncbi:hypothetical protein SUNI508_10777 [Seiridium unicorne]|uniref:Uncharacterized protein n=1 Tax=Seiridium unicorne TaxID=138068 RepID=A0ABR2UJZ9_9PEZI
MRNSIAALALLIAALVQGAPTPVDSLDLELDVREIDARAVRHGFADFERLDTSSRTIKEIGYYGGLEWHRIAAVNGTSTAPASAIRPHSPDNVAVYGALNGTFTTTVPIITAQYNNSKTSDFSIRSFYFGCVGISSGIPMACKMAIAGYDSDGNNIAYHPSYFTPTAGRKNHPQLVVLDSSFSGLAYVRLATTFLGNSVLGVTVLDDFTYSITTTS